MSTASPIRALWVMDHLGMPGGVIHGATRYFLNVLPHLDPAQVQLTLCFLGPMHPFVEQLRAAGIDPIFFERKRWDIRALGDVRRLAGQLQPHIMHLGGMKSMIVGRIVAPQVGARAIIHLHDVKPPSTLIGYLHRHQASRTDLAIGVSEEAARFAHESFGVPAERCVALPNGIPLDQYRAAIDSSRDDIRRELNLPRDAAVVGVVGRLFPDKSADLMIEQLPAILQRCPYAQLLLVGDGPERPRLEAMAHKLGVTERVRFTGQRHDVPRMLAAMDVLAVPTRIGEGLSLSAIEAMAAGRVVIGFRKGGFPELVRDGETGVLVPPDDDEAFGRMCGDLLADPARIARLGAAGAQAVEPYSVEQHLQRLYELYRQVVERRPCAAAPSSKSGDTDRCGHSPVA
jgi:glycosyltransferase involved in cell wall biosynthesis